MNFNNLIIIGLGLMGGSIALSAKRAKIAKQVIAYDQQPAVLAFAKQQKIIERGETELNNLASEELDKDTLLVIATPIGSSNSIINKLPADSAALCMEIGSAKTNLLKLYAKFNKKPLAQNFIPVHPIAGGENNGITYATAELFNDTKCIICPLPVNAPAQVRAAAQVWQQLGSSVFYMDPALHDKIFAQASHLPHVLAYNLIGTISQTQEFQESINFCGGGLRDFTRIAASDTTMWTDIFLTNRRNIIKSLGKFQAKLADTRRLLQENEHGALKAELNLARSARSLISGSAGTAVNKLQVPQQQEIDYLANPGENLAAELSVATDKSISHRALMLGSIAKGTTIIHNLLPAADTLNTLKIMKSLGAEIIEKNDYRTIQIKGQGSQALRKPTHSLDCGNSGTAARLLCGLLSGQAFSAQLQGDASLSERPMGRVIKPLSKMGAVIYANQEDRLPLLLMGGHKLQGIKYELPVPSAQIKSALLLAALQARGETVIRGGGNSRDHTERMLKNFGYTIQCNKNGDLALHGQQPLKAAIVNVPADISSAAFFIVAACITPGSAITLKNVGVNPTRNGILKVLELMNAKVELSQRRQYDNEPIADIHASYSQLRAIDLGRELVTLAIDEIPVIMIAAACAQGTTKISGAEELKVKETDRLAAMVTGLTQLGIKVQATSDGALITGGTLSGGQVDSYGDHRIAMSFAVAANVATDTIRIKRCSNVKTSFPNFISCAQAAGMNIEQQAAS